MKNPASIAKTRPAETATPIAMVVALLIGKAFDADAETVAYIALLVAFVPAAVTWMVNLIRS